MELIGGDTQFLQIYQQEDFSNSAFWTIILNLVTIVNTGPKLFEQVTLTQPWRPHERRWHLPTQSAQWASQGHKAVEVCRI